MDILIGQRNDAHRPGVTGNREKIMTSTIMIGTKVMHGKIGRTITSLRGDNIVLDEVIETTVDAVSFDMPGMWVKGYYAAAVHRVSDAHGNWTEHEFICKDEIFYTDTQAIDFGEIHSPDLPLKEGHTLESKQGGYVQISEHTNGYTEYSRVISRQQFDYFNEPDNGDDYDPDAAYERHLEDRGWVAAAAQDEWEATRGCLDYWQAKAAAEGRMPD